MKKDHTTGAIHLYLQKNVLAVKPKIAKNALCVIGAKGKYHKRPTHYFAVVPLRPPPLPTGSVTRIIYVLLHTEKKNYDSAW
jgi:hypothetical protein